MSALELIKSAVTEDTVQAAHKSMHRLTAAGTSAWTMEIAQPILNSRFVSLFVFLIQHIAAGLVDRSMKPYLYGGRLIALVKKMENAAPKLRPIVVGEFFAKLAAKSLMIGMTKPVTKLLVEAHQVGVAVPKGAEYVIHGLRLGYSEAMKSRDSEWSMAATDYSNAYNSISRKLLHHVIK